MADERTAGSAPGLPEPGLTDLPDPGTVGTREELAAALTAQRTAAGLSIRAVVARSGARHGTVTGWFAGNHVPTAPLRPELDAVLLACGVAEPGERARWWAAVERVRRSGSRRAADTTPYKGLAPFGPEDVEIFHGRGTTTTVVAAEALEALADGTGLVLVVGPSGVGKSSLLRAGVVPALTVPGRPLSGRSVVVVTPGRRPAASLAAALEGAAGPVLLVVDQLEELFTQGADPLEVAAFGDLLAAARDDGGLVLLGLRSDFFAAAAREPVLLGALRAHQVVLGPMDPAGLREAITAPAARAGRAVEPELVEQLLADLDPRDGRAGTDPGALPLLSHALLTTFAASPADRLTLAAYRATGSLQGAVAQSAEQVHDGLDPDQRAAARRLFLRLVAVDGPQVARRTATPAELEDEGGAAQEVVRRMAERRLLTLGDDTVEVTHEALLEHWPRLRGWVEGYRDDAATHRRLTDAAALWVGAERAPEYLLRGPRGEQLAEWAADPEHAGYLNAAERDLLAASAAQRAAEDEVGRRRGRRQVRLTAAAVVFGVLALVLALVAGLAVVRADREQAAAESSRDAAVAVQLAVQAGTLRDRDPSLSAQLALAAYRTDPSAAARSALLDTTAQVVPSRLTGAEGSMAMAPSPDGAVLAVVRADGSLELVALDPVTAAPTRLAELADAGTGSPVLYDAAIDPTGRLLAVAGGTGLVRVLDISDPRAPRQLGPGLRGADDVVRHLAWAPGGGQLAAASADGQVHRWQVGADGTGTALPSVLETGPLQTAAFSPDGGVLVTGASDGTAKLWDVADPAAPPTLLATVPTSSDTNFVLALAVSPDGRTLAVGAKDKVVRTVDVSDPRAPVVAQRQLTGMGSYVNAVDFSADGRQLVGAGSDNRTLVWDLASGAVTTTLTGPGVTTGASFLAGDATVVTATVDGAVRVWPLASGPLRGARDTVFYTDFSADGRVLAVGPNTGDQRVMLWELGDEGGPRRLGVDLLPPPGQRLDSSPSISPDASVVASGTATGSVVLWDVRDPSAPTVLGSPLETGLGLVQNTDISADGRTLVAAVDPGVVLLWDVTDPARPVRTARLDVGSVVLDVEVSPDGRTLAASSGANTVRLWDLTGSAPRELPALTGFTNTTTSLSFSPDSTRLAASSYDRSVLVWDVADPAAARRLARMTGPVSTVVGTTYAPDGRQVAVASQDGAVWVFDVAADGTWSTVATLTAGGGRTVTALFRPVGRQLVAFGAEASRAGRVWDVDPAAAAARVCAAVGDPITEEEWRTYAVGVPYAPPC